MDKLLSCLHVHCPCMNYLTKLLSLMISGLLQLNIASRDTVILAYLFHAYVFIHNGSSPSFSYLPRSHLTYQYVSCWQSLEQAKVDSESTVAKLQQDISERDSQLASLQKDLENARHVCSSCLLVNPLEHHI